MGDLKRHGSEITDGLSFMSPFHKEIKLEGQQHPGQQYFYQMNNNSDMLLRGNFQQGQQSNNPYAFQCFPVMQQFPPQQYYAFNGSVQQQQQSQGQQQQQQQQQFQVPQGNNNCNNPSMAQFSQQQQQQAQLSFLQPKQQQSLQQISQQQLQQQLPSSQSQQQSIQQQQQQMQVSPQSTSECTDNHKKSGERALQQFETFLQMTQHISNYDMSLEFVKDLYTIKLDTLPSNKEMLDVYQKILSKQGYSKQQKKNWNDNETNLLVWIILKSCALKRIDFRELSDEVWEDIATMMVGRNADQCKLKWLSMSKLNLQQQPWSEEEDQALIEIIKEYEAKNKANKWSEISVKLNQISHKNVFRQGKQCRERWNNHLDPAINRGAWTDEEELGMLQLVLQKGKRWSEISKSMKSSRTENAVKNRFNSIVKKDKHQSSEKSTTNNNSSTTTSSCSLSDLKIPCQDLTETERQSIIATIEKYENRIRNGFSLISGGSQMHNQGLSGSKNACIEEESEENDDDNEEEDDEDDDEDDDNEDQSKTNKSHKNNKNMFTKKANKQQNRNLNNNPSMVNQEESLQEESMESQSLSCIIKTEEQSSSQHMLKQHQQGQLSQMANKATTSTNQHIQKKAILQSKQALIQLVESEAKIKSEQSLSHSDSHPPSTIFQPINNQTNNQSFIIAPEVTKDKQQSQQPQQPVGCDSPSLNLQGAVHQQPPQFSGFAMFQSGNLMTTSNTSNLGNIYSRRSSRRLSSEYQYIPSAQMQQYEKQIGSEVSVKSLTRCNAMKSEEFEEEITRSQLVYVDKQNQNMYLVTPSFLQQKIADDLSNNIAVLNSFMFANNPNNHEQFQTPTNQMNQSQQQQQQQQFYAAAAAQNASLSLFLNSPQMQQSQGDLSTPSNLFSYYNAAAVANAGGNNSFLGNTNNNNNAGVNSPGMFFITYPNTNALASNPNILTPNTLTPNNHNTLGNNNNNGFRCSPATQSQQQQQQQQARMINQMPIHTLIHSASPQAPPNSQTLHTAAILNKHLIGQDIQTNMQLQANTNTLSNINSNSNLAN